MGDGFLYSGISVYAGASVDFFAGGEKKAILCEEWPDQRYIKLVQ